MPQRTFGWIQNPGNLSKLKDLAGIFIHGSVSNLSLVNERLPLLKRNNLISDSDYNDFVDLLSRKEVVIPYAKLKGKGSGSNRRRDALCTGIAQAVIDAQGSRTLLSLDGRQVEIKKPYTDDWTADGYVRWGVSVGLLEYIPNDDCVRISELGVRLVKTEPGSTDEKEVFFTALMSYPPVQRILKLLSDDTTGEGMTKFELGQKLGFVGEMGFTSIDQGYFLALLDESDDPKTVKSNIEGDADKYARMIAGWLTKMGWVKTVRKEVSASYRNIIYSNSLQAYKITAKGQSALKRALGNSSNRRIDKIVHFEMLATKVPNAGYVRSRRAYIIKALSRDITIADISAKLKSYGLEESLETIKDDIEGLVRIGLDIVYDNRSKKYCLKDRIIALEIPNNREIKQSVTVLKDRVRDKLNYISHDYLILIDLAYSDASENTKKIKDAKDFEIFTANLLTKELSFHGERLGGADKPDVVIWKDQCGIIIDNKSYGNGFNIGRNNEDEMVRYIDQAQQRISQQPQNEWWRIFPEDTINSYNFLFVTSFLTGQYITNLQSIHVRTGINGGAIDVENLLYLAEKIRRGDLMEEAVSDIFNNDKICVNL